MTEFKSFQRVVTGHDENGHAIIRSDDLITPEVIKGGQGEGFATVWSAPTIPVDNNDETDGRDRNAGITLPGGSVIRIVDTPPGAVSPMHRTNSIDYGIVLEGEIELELDNGVKTTIKAGGIIVQRGTMHAWRNTTNKMTRVVFVLTEAKPYMHKGKPLDDARPEDMEEFQ